MNKKWYTTIEYVDRQTGEMISKQRVERENYKVFNKTKQIIKHSTHEEIRYRHECERSGQLEFKF